jgi:hypothetical protein
MVYAFVASRAIPAATSKVPSENVPQLPPLQVPPEQLWLQRPQFAPSLATTVHSALQAVKPVVHEIPQVDPLQSDPPLAGTGQAIPHAVPQLLAVEAAWQVPLQSRPVLHPHVPLWQTVPPVQACPQEPQFALLVSSLTHAPLHPLKPVLQVKLQLEPLQTGAAFATAVVQGDVEAW